MNKDLNKNYLDVIKCETDNNMLITKSTVENFNTKSQLIVNESQEALFYKDGRALDLFGPGRHSLNTDNLPFIKRLYGAIFGGNNAFACEVIYINKVSVLDIFWGTDAPVVIEDPKYHLIVGVKANGQTGLRIKDSRKFVVKVVGQLREFTVEAVRKTIKGLLLSSVKEVIASTIVEQNITVLEISTRISELSFAVQSKLNVALDDLGIEVLHFHIAGIAGDETDLAKLREVKERQLSLMSEADMEAYKIQKIGLTETDVEAYKLQRLGYTYQEKRKFDVLETAAQNNSTAGGMINAGLGLGVGLGVIDETKRMTASAVNPSPAPAQSASRACPACQSQVPKLSKFCPECGQQLPPEVKFCAECGSKLSPGSKFCPECGTKI